MLNPDRGDTLKRTCQLGLSREQRSQPRVSAQFSSELSNERGCGVAYVENLSVFGMWLTSDLGLSRNEEAERFEVGLDLPGARHAITALGHIARVDPSGRGLAVSLSYMNQRDLARVQTFVALRSGRSTRSGVTEWRRDAD